MPHRAHCPPGEGGGGLNNCEAVISGAAAGATGAANGGGTGTGTDGTTLATLAMLIGGRIGGGPGPRITGGGERAISGPGPMSSKIDEAVTNEYACPSTRCTPSVAGRTAIGADATEDGVEDTDRTGAGDGVTVPTGSPPCGDDSTARRLGGDTNGDEGAAGPGDTGAVTRIGATNDDARGGTNGEAMDTARGLATSAKSCSMPECADKCGDECDRCAAGGCAGGV